MDYDRNQRIVPLPSLPFGNPAALVREGKGPMKLSWRWIALLVALFVAVCPSCSRSDGAGTPNDTGQGGASKKSPSDQPKEMRKDDDDDEEEDEGRSAATKPSQPGGTA